MMLLRGLALVSSHTKSHTFYLKILLILLLAWALNWTSCPGVAEQISVPQGLERVKCRTQI